MTMYVAGRLRIGAWNPARKRGTRTTATKLLFLGGVLCLLVGSYNLNMNVSLTENPYKWQAVGARRGLPGSTVIDGKLKNCTKLTTLQKDVTAENFDFGGIKDVGLRSKLRYDYMRRQCDNFYHVREYNPDVDGKALWALRGKMAGAYSNDEYNFTIFTVMKVGSWHWNNLMEDLYKKSSPEFRKLNRKPLIALRGANESVYLNRLKSHFKIIFVRHPLARALSAWRDKFVDHHTAWYKPWAQRMLRMFRNNPTRADLNRPTPTVLEFVRYITESGDNEVHWKPVWDFYKPCRIHFDFIGRLETVDDDVGFLLDKLKIRDKVAYRPRDSKRHTTDLQLVRKTLATLPQDLFQRLVKKYEEDFRLFGYHIPLNASDIRL